MAKEGALRGVADGEGAGEKWDNSRMMSYNTGHYSIIAIHVMGHYFFVRVLYICYGLI